MVTTQCRDQVHNAGLTLRLKCWRRVSSVRVHSHAKRHSTREEKVWLCGVSACAGGIISLEEQQILFSVCEHVHLLMCVLLYN